MHCRNLRCFFPSSFIHVSHIVFLVCLLFLCQIKLVASCAGSLLSFSSPLLALLPFSFVFVCLLVSLFTTLFPLNTDQRDVQQFRTSQASTPSVSVMSQKDIPNQLRLLWAYHVMFGISITFSRAHPRDLESFLQEQLCARLVCYKTGSWRALSHHSLMLRLCNPLLGRVLFFLLFDYTTVDIRSESHAIS